MLPLLCLALLAPSVFPIQELDLTPMTSGWDRPQVDKSIQGTPLTLNGRVYPHGVGTHVPSTLNLRLDGALAFDSMVGVDDETKGKGSVEFLILVDGVVKWRSRKIRGGDSAKSVHIDLSGATTLSLRAVDAGDGVSYAHADWADARITTSGHPPVPMRDLRPINVETAHAALKLYVSEEGQLLQRSFGAKGLDWPESQPAFPAAGDGWVYEPALRITHADGNTSCDLKVVGTHADGNLTQIQLKDPEYPFNVDLYFQTYPEQDVIETWTEIHHTEHGPVTLHEFASASPQFGKTDHYLTQFQGDWEQEASMSEEKLTYGIKTLDSKLGVRANLNRTPWFLLSNGGPAKEDSGEVFGGSLAWSGSFSFDFEVDSKNQLRSVCGINPYESEYHLKPGEKFETPKMVWGWSGVGTGQLTRNLHQWVRTHALREGNTLKKVLLNNWEATYFTFDEKKIVSLFDGAKELGLELFLLDDGWFGKKYPRDGDTQGLGDWMPDPKKLPNGLRALTDAANKRDLKFGVWLEPEMVNPKSELFEKHPDWVIQQPKRKLDLQRNQLILDLSRPEVKEFVFQVADKTLTDDPDIAYVKWDCNRHITQPGSTYLDAKHQTHLWIDYVRALYDIFDRLTKKHPNVEIMMCSGGGGRVDYGAMRYAHELWPSDMTDPAKRIFIQWGFSYFFPGIAMANHVTHSGGHSLKYGFDVAMSGRMGMDMDLDKLSAKDREFAKNAIACYKSIRDVVQLGDLYRLESPYDGPRSSQMIKHGDRSVLFVYSICECPAGPLKLKGLDPSKTYHLKEIDLEGGETGLETSQSGKSLLEEGLAIPAMDKYKSKVIEITQ